MDWKHHARNLADEVTHQGSRWRLPVARTPRHLFVPRWWDWPSSDTDGYTLRDGVGDEQAWLRAAYSDETLVTQVAGQHADHANPGDRPTGRPTSSSTLPSLVMRMLGHCHITDGNDILDVATGSGYSAALLSHRLGDHRVTSIDIDPYLTQAATERLNALGLHPKVITCDATGPLPGTFDGIVSMVSIPTIPRSWLDALRPGGRLVTVIAGTAMILTANRKTADDGTVYAEGRIERDWATFMPTRTGATPYPTDFDDQLTQIQHADGDDVTQGRYPVIRVRDAWELLSILEVTAPGIEHHYEENIDGTRTAWMLHPDGSWARATAHGTDAPTVHQAGPQRLWTALDDLRDEWLRHGYFQLFGAKAFIMPNGKIHLTRGDWTATIAR